MHYATGTTFFILQVCDFIINDLWHVACNVLYTTEVNGMKNLTLLIELFSADCEKEYRLHGCSARYGQYVELIESLKYIRDMGVAS